MLRMLTENESAEKSGRKGRYSPPFSKNRYVTKSDEVGARIMLSNILGIIINPTKVSTVKAIIIRIKCARNSSKWSQKDISSLLICFNAIYLGL